ncbi:MULTISPECIES: type II toxin-antitoxin system TacA family antitoxin [Cysteiniphilum]|uniref:DUF1778 domain-containing protein n=1 Tax=Cysteiniphilum litorale TaxID=2056700 RepID=A0A8J2Z3L8_9GAMM|nr:MULTISPECIES: DUF1778 domain-containing protein [Cysteiniphilum]GGF91918.1 hypothetical protein GCM10010995_06320 [Cysteiniphilum litorale]
MSKSARIEFKVTADSKAIFEKAAQLMGVSLTEFGMRAMTSFAKKVTTEQNLIKLTLSQQENFFAALENPPKVNDALKKAYLTHKDTLSQ